MSITAEGAANSKEKELNGEAVLDARANQGLRELGLAPLGLGGLGSPEMTREASYVLSEYVCSLVKRAGLQEAFRALLVNVAVETNDRGLGDLLGCKIIGGGTQGTAYVMRPAGIGKIQSPELGGRERAKRVGAGEAVRQGAGE